MRVINGKHARRMDGAEVAAWAAAFGETTVDLGTGDDRFVRHLTEGPSRVGAIGVDLCEATLQGAARGSGGNALFVVADALALPADLGGIATRVSVNFPWGGLLRGLVDGHPGLLAGLEAVGRGGAALEIRVNAGALAEVGWTLKTGSERVAAVLHDAGAKIGGTRVVGPAELRRWPTTWAKRLAFGRDPRAVLIEATLA